MKRQVDPAGDAVDEVRGSLRRRDSQRVDDDGLACTRLDRGGVGALEEAEVGTGAVDAEVRDGDVVLRGERDGLADPRQHLVAVDAVCLQLEVGHGGFDHGMPDAELDERLDVGLDCPREAPDLSAQPRLGDEPDGAGVVLGHARKPRLDTVDPERVKQPCDLKLLLRIERDADRLLAVTERRVVQADRPARLRLERAAVEIPEEELVPRDGHVRTIPSGNGQSFSGASSVISQLSSMRSPPPPSQ